MASEEGGQGVMGGCFMVIDGGNTRLKATFFPAGDGEPQVMAFASDETERILAEAERRGVEMGAMAVVGHVDSRLAESLRVALDGRFLLVTPTTSLPIRVDYRNPEKLGLDRKATSVAAAAAYPAARCLVMDAGSALTCDLVADGAFLCGSISPGLSMRFRALHEFTAGLPKVSLAHGADKCPAPFAADTDGAIAGGVVNGLLREVAADIMAASVQLGGLDRVILTGGDAPLMMSLLGDAPQKWLPASHADKISITYDPHLLAKGVRDIYIYHEDEF